MHDGLSLLLLLVLSIVAIILLTAKVRMNAFFVLILVALGVGLAAGIPVEKIAGVMKDGFGSTLGSIGIIIICGTTIGVILERTGAALSMAEAILRIVGKSRVPLSMSVLGFIVGVPIFCDSGFIVLSALNRSLAQRSSISMSVMATALATALYSVHCLVPPHPGATAAAGVIGADIGTVILLGLIPAVAAATAGYVWSTRFGRRYEVRPQSEVSIEELKSKYITLPHPIHSFVPIVFPVTLIALKSVAILPSRPFGDQLVFAILSIAGDPSIALLAGVLVALTLVPKWTKEILDTWLQDGVKNAGLILAITAAGGAFGAVLRATQLGSAAGQSLSMWGLGIFLPFALAAVLKTAQGSSTVAILTAASMISPMLQPLGFAEGYGPVLVVLAMGAGSMIASHANDSYFWVVSKFSNLDLSVALKVFTTATILVGMVAMAVVYLMSLVLL